MLVAMSCYISHMYTVYMNTIVVTKIARCLRHQLDELNCFNAAQRNTKSYNRKFLIQNIPGKTNIPSNRQISKESNRRHILGEKKKSASKTTTRSICSALYTAKRTTIPPFNGKSGRIYKRQPHNKPME